MAVLLLEVRIFEMAKLVTNTASFVSKLTDDPADINPEFYHAYKKLPVIHDLSNSVKLHGATVGNGSAYFATLDHSSQRTVHVTKVIAHKADLIFPYDRIEQDLVDKDSNHPFGNTPGYARSFAYSHWETQHLPFRSSPDQAFGGHKMWKKYAEKALNDGKHVYYHSPETGFIPLNHENLNDYHSRYFGETPEYLKRSLVLSHTELP